MRKLRAGSMLIVLTLMGAFFLRADPVFAATLTVTTTSDTGPGSLRQAILDANAMQGADVIQFNIPTTDSNFDASTGTFTIRPTSPLPKIGSGINRYGIIIDGATQTAFTGDTNPAGPEIVLNGEAAGDASGLVIAGNDTVVKGLVINRFSQAGVFVGDAQYFAGGSNNKIEGCYIGTDATGEVAVGNGFGVGLNFAASGNVIGGTTAEARNVISGNTGGGVGMYGGGRKDPPTESNDVQNNYIGTNALGSAALGNGGAGVSIYNNAPNNRIINNVISSNGKDGIYIYGAGTETTVRGNSIGAAADGKTALGNRGNGIYLRTFTDGSIEIGGPIAREGSDISGNTIAYNQGAGVAIAYGRNHDISANAIFSNTGLGIDLDANGVTPNDVGDGDTSVYAVGGANDLQNFPVLTGVFRSSGSTTVQGVLNSTPNRVFGIEFFSNATCDASGYGEGQHFLGRTTVTTNDGGNATFSVELPVTVPEGQFITATATNSMYASTNTSEFSACVAGATPGLVQFSAATYAANENDGAATITVTRTARGSGTVTVKFVTGDGTATSGRDYTSVSGILTFAPGETTKTFTIPITDDFTHEPDETVNLTLSEPTNGALLGNPATAVLTIRDNDAGRSSIFLPLVQR